LLVFEAKEIVQGSLYRERLQPKQSPRGRKQFFFEKKNQKTFAKLGFGLSGQAEAKMMKSFLLLFFKKEGLPSCLLRASWATDLGS
jgi:hypothetical protein